MDIPSGTAIATFPNGKYSGHAAIYVSQDYRGIQVYDQVCIDSHITKILKEQKLDSADKILNNNTFLNFSGELVLLVFEQSVGMVATFRTMEIHFMSLIKRHHYLPQIL